MKDKYIPYFIIFLCLVSVILVVLVTLFFYRKGMEIPNEVDTRNVLPINEDKELVKPDEVRQYVLAMADIKGVNVDMVDKIGYCESRWDSKAVSKSGTYVGIFQIGKIHQLGDNRFDVVKSTKWSLDKMKKEGFNAWECSKI